MKIINGIGVSKGYVSGPVFYFQNQEEAVEKVLAEDVDVELERFAVATETAKSQLEELYQEAVELVGENEAAIFRMHKMLLDDDEFSEAAVDYMRSERVNAEYGVWLASQELQRLFRSMENEYMKERAADIYDISKRVIQVLQGRADKRINAEGILFAEDLTPSETIGLDQSKILAIVTEKGSAISHSAILARTLGIPAIVGAAGIMAAAAEGTVIVDGTEGTVFLEPDQETVTVYEGKMKEYREHQQMLRKLKGTIACTKDGCSVELACNIGNPGDVASVLENDGESIGLFRSEFLYMGSSDFPTEDEQCRAYQQVLTGMEGKRVIVRTLDLGADKHVPYFDLGEEENPALGYRAIRICLRQKDIFRTQLRALLRASVHGRLAIMFPMIATVSELRQAKEYLAEVKAELDGEGIAYSESIEVGMMIETPSAVMVSDLLAKEADFFSIGTNDLTQYTLAVDRMNGKIADLYDSKYTSILRMIKLTADNAHKEGKWVGICGESAADEELTGFYLAIGIDELSVSPGAVLGLKARIQQMDVERVKDAELLKWLQKSS